MTQPTNRRFVMEDRLAAELVTVNASISAEAAARIAADAVLQGNIDDVKQTSRVYVKNGASTITKGTPVYITGADGTNIIIGVSSNASEATSSKTLGLLESTLTANQMGYVVTDGKLTNIDTSGATAEGDSVWLGVAGAKLYGLANKPVAPAHMVYLGVVSRKNANTGEIQVKIQNGFELDELHNVSINSGTLADKQVLAYESATQLWKNKQATGGVTVGASSPTSPNAGDAWFDSNDGTLYVWYVDADTSQWVQVQANSALEGTILARLSALEGTAAAFGNLSPNYFINGSLEINQRGFTSSTTNGLFVADRFVHIYNTGTVTNSLLQFTPGVAPVSGYEYPNYIRTVTSGQSGTGAYSILIHRIEDVRTLAGQTATVSFWAKAASGTPKIAIELEQNFGSGGSPSGVVQTYPGAITLTGGTSWTRYSITFNVPSLVGKTIGTTANTSSLNVNFWTSAGTDYNTRASSIGIQSNTFDMFGFQIERGSQVTAFRRNAPNIQAELAACQRYYIKYGVDGSTSSGAGWGQAVNTTVAYINIFVPVEMRAIPVVETGGSPRIADYASGFAVSSVGVTWQSKKTIMISVSGAGFTAWRNYTFEIATAAASIALNAEL